TGYNMARGMLLIEDMIRDTDANQLSTVTGGEAGTAVKSPQSPVDIGGSRFSASWGAAARAAGFDQPPRPEPCHARRRAVATFSGQAAARRSAYHAIYA